MRDQVWSGISFDSMTCVLLILHFGVDISSDTPTRRARKFLGRCGLGSGSGNHSDSNGRSDSELSLSPTPAPYKIIRLIWLSIVGMKEETGGKIFETFVPVLIETQSKISQLPWLWRRAK